MCTFTYCFNYLFVLVLRLTSIVSNSNANILTENWKFHFPGGSTMGIFVAVATPLEKVKNTFLAYNFEANYALPNSKVRYDYPPLVERAQTAKQQRNGFERRFIYDAIESKMQMYGVSGKNCLLRTICEAAEESLINNGVIGDVLHVIFTPSSSNDTIQNEYDQAEINGKTGNCTLYNKNCKISFLGLISWIGHAL